MWYNISIMSNITTEDVQHLAQLSSISLGSSADVAALRQNLEDILHYIEQLLGLAVEQADNCVKVPKVL